MLDDLGRGGFLICGSFEDSTPIIRQVGLAVPLKPKHQTALKRKMSKFCSLGISESCLEDARFHFCICFFDSSSCDARNLDNLVEQCCRHQLVIGLWVALTCENHTF